jgi:hypothetical protein
VQQLGCKKVVNIGLNLKIPKPENAKFKVLSEKSPKNTKMPNSKFCPKNPPQKYQGCIIKYKNMKMQNLNLFILLKINFNLLSF